MFKFIFFLVFKRPINIYLKKITTTSFYIKKSLFSRYQIDIIMNDKILFSEQQKFRQPWHWAIQIAMLGIPCVFLWRLIHHAAFEQLWENNAVGNNDLLTGTIITTIVIIPTILLMQRMRLETSITGDEIKIKFFPFRRSFKSYKWEDITTASIQKINPLKYGGWGIHSNSRFKIKFGLGGFKITNYEMYNISGRYVLQLELKSKKTILIGTQKAKDLEVVLDKIERKNKEY